MRPSAERWLIGVLVLISGAYAVAEELNLTTYFPAPRGVYEEVRVSDTSAVPSATTVTLSTPGTQPSHEARVDLFTRDNDVAPNRRGQADAGDTLWTISAHGDTFNPPGSNDLEIRKHAADGTEATVLTLDAGTDATAGADNVGIATTDPTQRLTLGAGNILLPNANLGTDGNLFFGGLTHLNQNGLRFFGGLVNGVAPEGVIDVRASGATEGLHFRADTVQAATGRMLIRADGRVSIGPTAPDPLTNTLLKVDGSVELGDPLETTNANNRWRFCGSGTNPARCNTASELIAGNVMLSTDGSFVNAENRYAQWELLLPGAMRGSLGVGSNMYIGGNLLVATTAFDPTFRAIINGDTDISSGKLTVTSMLSSSSNIVAAGDIAGQVVTGRSGLCINGVCVNTFAYPPPPPPPPLGSGACTWRSSGGCSNSMILPVGRAGPCQANEFANAWRIWVAGGCGDDKDDIGESTYCCGL